MLATWWLWRPRWSWHLSIGVMNWKTQGLILIRLLRKENWKACRPPLSGISRVEDNVWPSSLIKYCIFLRGGNQLRNYIQGLWVICKLEIDDYVGLIVFNRCCFFKWRVQPSLSVIQMLSHWSKHNCSHQSTVDTSVYFCLKLEVVSENEHHSETYIAIWT